MATTVSEFLEGIRVRDWVAQDPAMVRIRTALEQVRPPLGADEPQLICEELVRFLVTQLHARESVKLRTQLEAVTKLQDQIQSIYDTAVTGGLSDSLTGRLKPLLEQRMELLDKLRLVADTSDIVDRTVSADDILKATEERRAQDVEPAAPGAEPDLPLDEQAGEVIWRGRGEHDRASLAAYRDSMKMVPESVVLRASVKRAAVDWVDGALADQVARVTLYRVPDYSQGNLAALARFGGLDPRFSGRGYEVQLELKNGTRFRPDGIRFLDATGRRFQFLEFKEPYTWTDGAFYAGPEGQAKLTAMLHRDAATAQQLRGNGCAGFRYDTGHPELDDILAGVITDMRAQHVAGSDMLSVPMGRELP
jgi:hypothetical protein